MTPSVRHHVTTSNCIDGNYSTMCHNNGGGGWLQIDYGSYVEIALIVVYNRQVTLQVCHSKCDQSVMTVGKYGCP